MQYGQDGSLSERAWAAVPRSQWGPLLQGAAGSQVREIVRQQVLAEKGIGIRYRCDPWKVTVEASVSFFEIDELIPCAWDVTRVVLSEYWWEFDHSPNEIRGRVQRLVDSVKPDWIVYEGDNLPWGLDRYVRFRFPGSVVLKRI